MMDMAAHGDARSCARCDYPMVAQFHEGIRVDHCHRCGGSVIEPGGVAANVGHWAEPSFWKATLGRETQGETLRCPACAGKMTGFQVPWDGRSVVVDHCGTCGALFLDKGEGEKLVSIVRQAESQGAFKGAKDAFGKKTKATRPAYDVEEEMLSAQDSTDKPPLPVYIFQVFTGMPVEVWNPVRNSAMWTRTLTVILGVIFFISMGVSIGLGSLENIQHVFGYLTMKPDDILHGRRLWTLVTYSFLHGGIVHLLGNAYFLNVFGDNVEDRLGGPVFFGVFILSGLLGGVFQTVFQADPSISVLGASGGIAGLMGAYFVLFPRVKVWMVFFFMHFRVPIAFYFGGWILVNVAGWYLGGQTIAWWAHLGGFLSGCLLGFFLRDSSN